MDNRLLISASVLVAAMIGGIIVLLLDSRTQRLEKRVYTLGARTAAVVAPEADMPRSIRVAESRNSRLRALLTSVLQIPGDLPGVHVVPPPVVAAFGIGVGLAAAWGARFNMNASYALLAGAAIGVFVMRSLFRWESKRYASKLRAQMPDMIELLASSVRAGLPVTEAFRSVARELGPPTCDEFERVVREMSLGTAVDVALASVYQRTGVAEYSIFSVTLSVQSRSGGRLAETIQTLAETIRQRLALASRAQALAAEAKLSAMVLTLLPFISGVVMMFTQPNYIDVFLHDPRGHKMLMAGFILLALGQFTMRKMIAGATSE